MIIRVTVVSLQSQSAPCTSTPIFFLAPQIYSRALQNKITITPWIICTSAPKLKSTFSWAPQMVFLISLKIYDGISMNIYLRSFPKCPKICYLDFAQNLGLFSRMPLSCLRFVKSTFGGYFHERPKISLSMLLIK